MYTFLRWAVLFYILHVAISSSNITNPYETLYGNSQRTSQSSYLGPSKLSYSNEYVLPNQPRFTGMAMDVNGTMYLVTADAFVFAVNQNGTTLWTYSCDGDLAINVISIMYIYFWCTSNNYLFSCQGSPALGANGDLYFGTRHGTFITSASQFNSLIILYKVIFMRCHQLVKRVGLCSLAAVTS